MDSRQSDFELDISLRRAAIHVLAALPEKPEHARKVLDYAKVLIDEYIDVCRAPDIHAGKVTPIWR